MKILFDQGTPVPLRKALAEHLVETAYERGWQMLENGELLAKAESDHYEVLITTDQNLRYQQDLSERHIAIVVLLSTSWPRISKHTETIRMIVSKTLPGEYHKIEIP